MLSQLKGSVQKDASSATSINGLLTLLHLKLFSGLVLKALDFFQRCRLFFVTRFQPIFTFLALLVAFKELIFQLQQPFLPQPTYVCLRLLLTLIVQPQLWLPSTRLPSLVLLGVSNFIFLIPFWRGKLSTHQFLTVRTSVSLQAPNLEVFSSQLRQKLVFFFSRLPLRSTFSSKIPLHLSAPFS